jgi:hypothetical protein
VLQKIMNDAITDEQMAIYASATTDLRITLQSHEQRLAKAKLLTPATRQHKTYQCALQYTANAVPSS